MIDRSLLSTRRSTTDVRQPSSVPTTEPTFLTSLSRREAPNIIGRGQNGFVMGRQGLHNVRRLLHVIHFKKSYTGHSSPIIDAEKAFDKVEWPHLFEILQRFGLGKYFLGLENIFYLFQNIPLPPLSDLFSRIKKNVSGIYMEP